MKADTGVTNMELLKNPTKVLLLMVAYYSSIILPYFYSVTTLTCT